MTIAQPKPTMENKTASLKAGGGTPDGTLARTLRRVSSGSRPPQLLQTKTLFKKLGVLPETNRHGAVKFSSPEQNSDPFMWLDLFQKAKQKRRELLVKYHPDRFPFGSFDGQTAHEICLRISEIWEVIKTRFVRKCGDLEVSF
jgi:hypothetical protein